VFQRICLTYSGVCLSSPRRNRTLVYEQVIDASTSHAPKLSYPPPPFFFFLLNPLHPLNSHTERDNVPSEDDHFRQSGWAIHTSSFSSLSITTLTNMDIVDEEKRACLGLQHLRMRIRGLHTKDKIDQSLKLRREWNQRWTATPRWKRKKDTSIEARVTSLVDASVQTALVELCLRGIFVLQLCKLHAVCGLGIPFGASGKASSTQSRGPRFESWVSGLAPHDYEEAHLPSYCQWE